MEKLNYYVLYYLTEDRNSYICSNRVELNRPINNMEDLELIKKMIADEKYTQDNNKRWTVYGKGDIAGFSDVFKKELFDFLSWEDEKPTNIKELLENCEVIEDE